MDISSVVTQLRQEIEHIEQAIAALVGLGSQPPRRGRPPTMSQAKSVPVKKRRRMSAAARKRISAAMKQRWAQRKGKSAPKKVKTAPKKRAVRKPMSAATKKRLSELMKARWAAKKKTA